MKTIFLTGATGYLGSRLAIKILEQGFNLIALKLNEKEVFNYPQKFSNFVKVFNLDTCSLENIFAENKIDVVIHTATLYGRRNEHLEDMIKANIEFPLKILNLAVENGTRTFINTDTILVKNISPYSLTKNQFVDWLDMFSDKIKVVNLRLDHFYGPNDKPVKFVAWLIEQLKADAEKIDLTEGSQTRDFVYIEDVLSVYMYILSNLDKIPNGKRNNFEVGTGEKTSIKSFVTMLKNKMNNTKTNLNFGAIPYRKNEVLDYDVDISALMALGWKPKYNVERGIEDIIKTEDLLK